MDPPFTTKVARAGTFVEPTDAVVGLLKSESDGVSEGKRQREAETKKQEEFLFILCEDSDDDDESLVDKCGIQKSVSEQQGTSQDDAICIDDSSDDESVQQRTFSNVARLPNAPNKTQRRLKGTKPSSAAARTVSPTTQTDKSFEIGSVVTVECGKATYIATVEDPAEHSDYSVCDDEVLIRWQSGGFEVVDGKHVSSLSKGRPHRNCDRPEYYHDQPEYYLDEPEIEVQRKRHRRTPRTKNETRGRLLGTQSLSAAAKTASPTTQTDKSFEIGSMVNVECGKATYIATVEDPSEHSDYSVCDGEVLIRWDSGWFDVVEVKDVSSLPEGRPSRNSDRPEYYHDQPEYYLDEPEKGVQRKRRRGFPRTQQEPNSPYHLVQKLKSLGRGNFTFKSRKLPCGSYDISFETPVDNAVVEKCSKKTPNVLDLFAGVGGMSLGFKSEGFNVPWLVDNDRTLEAGLQCRHANTHTKTHIHIMDVGDFLKGCAQNKHGTPGLQEVDHIHVSSPCQGFSRANTTGSSEDRKAKNDLCYTLLDAIKFYESTTATFENVPGMCLEKNCEYLVNLVSGLLDLCYQVRILSPISADTYGDPQARSRIFLFAARAGFPLPKRPAETHGDKPPKLPVVTVRDALQDLEDVEPHSGGKVQLNGNLVSNHENFDENRIHKSAEKIKPDQPAKTFLTATKWFHYELKRSLTVREVARLFSFPDDFQIFGPLPEMKKHLGNAVPVKMARAVARSVYLSYTGGKCCSDAEEPDS